ncbi:MAG: sugar phosphate nucleotidyltransferase [Coriobacteriales bacterium]|jgi:mannose-1-phosphate guanylyltransferase
MESSLFPYLHAVVLCGQEGRELWPLTRLNSPRETLVLPDEEECLLWSMIRVLKNYVERPMTFMCPSAAADQIEKSIQASGLLKKGEYEILVEPYPRGTAFSVALAAAMLKRRNPDSYMVIAPSHIELQTEDRWEQALSRAYRVAAEDRVAIIGVDSQDSNSPHSFIRPAGSIRGIVGARELSSYYHKPLPPQAKRYTSIGLLWSTGIMVVRASTALAKLVYVAKHSSSPDSQDLDRIAETASFISSIDQGRWHSKDAEKLIESLPVKSFEEAVLEGAGDSAVIPTGMGLSTVTSLKSIDDFIESDESGNRIMGRGFAIDSENTTVYDDDRLTVTLGCEDLLVVNTRDSVLVASKEALDSLDEVVPSLVEAGAREVATSSVTQHSWGTGTLIYSGKHTRVKLVTMRSGHSTGNYSRKSVSESWTVLEGTATFEDSRGTLNLKAGQQISYKPGIPHELGNHGKRSIELICIESGASGVADDYLV